MKKSSQQLFDEIAQLTRELTEALNAEKEPKPVILSQSGGSTGGRAIHFTKDTTFDFDSGKLTIQDEDGDTVKLDLNPVLPPTWPRTETRFIYDGIERRGIVIGMQNARNGGVNVEILETWNERDGEHYEPYYKLFRAEAIPSAGRDRSDG